MLVLVVVVAAEEVVVLHTEQRVERGSRNKAAAAAAGSRLIGGRGRALLLHCCRVKLGFVKQRLEELCPLGMLPNSCWGRILRVKIAHKLRSKCRIENCDKNRSQLNGHCSER